MDKEALKREQLIAYIPSRDNYMTVGLYAAKPGKVLVAMVLNLHTGLPRTKRTWCNLHYNEKGCAYFIKYGYCGFNYEMSYIDHENMFTCKLPFFCDEAFFTIYSGIQSDAEEIFFKYFK